STSAALAVTASQTGQTTVHLHGRLGVALAAHRRAGGIGLGAVITIGRSRRRGAGTDERGALLVRVGALVLVHLVFEHADALEVLLQPIADFCHQRGHPAASALHIAAFGVEYAVQLLDQEGAVTALAEYRGNDQRQRGNPLVVLHVLR